MHTPTPRGNMGPNRRGPLSRHTRRAIPTEVAQLDEKVLMCCVVSRVVQAAMLPRQALARLPLLLHKSPAKPDVPPGFRRLVSVSGQSSPVSPDWSGMMVLSRRIMTSVILSQLAHQFVVRHPRDVCMPMLQVSRASLRRKRAADAIPIEATAQDLLSAFVCKGCRLIYQSPQGKSLGLCAYTETIRMHQQVSVSITSTRQLARQRQAGSVPAHPLNSVR